MTKPRKLFGRIKEMQPCSDYVFGFKLIKYSNGFYVKILFCPTRNLNFSTSFDAFNYAEPIKPSGKWYAGFKKGASEGKTYNS